ncbi:Leucine-rich repeat-containing protein 40 [Phlyctochytrium planicorne]|nr:Leucine-rich repeat-containing protein 40 [Phlyctochytrium planicorne]
MLRGRGGRSRFGGASNSGSLDSLAAKPDNSKSLLKMIRQARTSGKLNLSNQGLDVIPPSLFTREDVQPGTVSLDRNDTEFNWWEEVDISKLIIADNVLKEIDERIVELQGLTLLDATIVNVSFPPHVKNSFSLQFHNNKLTTVPDLSPLINVTILNLSSNSLTECTATIFNLPLAELHLANNSLTTLPSTISKTASTLTILDISKNSIETLPPEFTQLKNLTRLDISSNKLSQPLSFPSSSGPYNISLLDVSHNRLTSLGDLSGLTKVQEILASENALRTVFSKPSSEPSRDITLPNLSKLDLRVNRLESLACRYVAHDGAPLQGPESILNVSTPKLKDILLSSNRLTSLAVVPPSGDAATDPTAKGIVESALASLETLDVRDNNFSHVPPEAVLHMMELKRLFVEGNPIRFPRRTILEKGTATILKYLRDKQPE